MSLWKASATDYKYLDDEPDRLVTPVQVHWSCEAQGAEHTGRVYGATGLTDMPEFRESSMVRVTESIMINWVHGEMGAEWVTEQENTAAAALDRLENPTHGSTPPDEGV